MLLALTAALSISINHSPLQSEAGPLERDGRVLLPARAVFAALGAAVDYSAAGRRIDIRRGGRFVRLTLGSDRAQVGGNAVRLDAPARLYAGRTYVPLRFVAEALGASVHYDGALRVVAIDDPNAPAALDLAARGGKPADGSLHDYGPPTVVRRHPAQGDTVTGAYPSIYAEIVTNGGPAIDPASVRLYLDGRDVTDRMYRSGDVVGYTPAYELPAGTHEVTVQGSDQGGAHFSATWNFQSNFAYAPGQTRPNLPPAYPGTLAGWPNGQPIAMYLNGPNNYLYGNTMQIFVIAPAGGYGYLNLCGYGTNYALTPWPGDPTRYYSNIALPPNLYAPACYVNGYFYGPGGFANYIALGSPVVINTLLPQRPKPIAPNPYTGATPVPAGSPQPSGSPYPYQRRYPLAMPAPVHTPPAPARSTPHPAKTPQAKASAHPERQTL